MEVLFVLFFKALCDGEHPLRSSVCGVLGVLRDDNQGCQKTGLCKPKTKPVDNSGDSVFKV